MPEFQNKERAGGHFLTANIIIAKLFPEKTSVFPAPKGLVPEVFTVSANIFPTITFY
jgi:hypothetical protein